MAKVFHKYAHIRQIGDEVENRNIFDYPDDEIIIEEKIDGGNGRFHLNDDGVIIFGSRNMVMDKTMSESKNYNRFTSFIKETIGDKKLNPNYIYYGEIMIKHTLAYDFANNPPFIGFDIGYEVNNITTNGVSTIVYLSYDDKIKEFERLGIPYTNLQYRGKVRDLKTDELISFIKQSSYGELDQEGIVVKNYGRTNRYGRQMFAKIVTKLFKEHNKMAFKGLKKTSEDTDKLINEFVTPARITKIVNKYITEYERPLDKRLMSDVPREVILDVFNENMIYILKNYQEVNFKLLKKCVPAECLKVIEGMMYDTVKQSEAKQNE